MIFPLMMFKRFHIEFDAENKMISFYTQNSSILEIPKKPEQSSSFSVFYLLLIIFIVLFVIVIAFVVFHCIRKRRNSNNGKENKASNKFEDGEDFKQMDERLFN